MLALQKIPVSLDQVQELTCHSSKEGLYMGFRFQHDGEVLEGMVQLPTNGDSAVAQDPNGHRDLVVFQNDEGTREVWIMTELGRIFVEMFLPA
jgi:hypothetical protein